MKKGTRSRSKSAIRSRSRSRSRSRVRRSRVKSRVSRKRYTAKKKHTRRKLRTKKRTRRSQSGGSIAWFSNNWKSVFATAAFLSALAVAGAIKVAGDNKRENERVGNLKLDMYAELAKKLKGNEDYKIMVNTAEQLLKELQEGPGWLDGVEAEGDIQRRKEILEAWKLYGKNYHTIIQQVNRGLEAGWGQGGPSEQYQNFTESVKEINAAWADVTAHHRRDNMPESDEKMRNKVVSNFKQFMKHVKDGSLPDLLERNDSDEIELMDGMRAIQLANDVYNLIGGKDWDHEKLATMGAKGWWTEGIKGQDITVPNYEIMRKLGLEPGKVLVENLGMNKLKPQMLEEYVQKAKSVHPSSKYTAAMEKTPDWQNTLKEIQEGKVRKEKVSLRDKGLRTRKTNTNWLCKHVRYETKKDDQGKDVDYHRFKVTAPDRVRYKVTEEGDERAGEWFISKRYTQLKDLKSALDDINKRDNLPNSGSLPPKWEIGGIDKKKRGKELERWIAHTLNSHFPDGDLEGDQGDLLKQFLRERSEGDDVIMLPEGDEPLVVETPAETED